MLLSSYASNFQNKILEEFAAKSIYGNFNEDCTNNNTNVDSPFPDFTFYTFLYYTVGLPGL